MDIIESTVFTDEQKEILAECKKSIKKYNQAAILLHTGGGKSYIAANLIDWQRGSLDEFKVLWIATQSSIDRVKALYADTPILNECITYVTFNMFAKYSNYADVLEKQCGTFDMVIIDEAHKALGKQTLLGVQNAMSKFKKSTLIVMTATKVRGDRRQTFQVLTPKLKLDTDFKDRALDYAINNGLICDFCYKVCNLNLLKQYYAAFNKLREYSSIYKEYDYILEQSKKLINDYNNNVYSKLGEAINKDIECDGSEGDRWFVFFYRVEEIKESVGYIEEMFKIAYGRDDLKVNIMQFTSESATPEMVATINGEPTHNQIDVILTCNKGAESLHPKNTRGVIMLRTTFSNAVFEQQLGRALEIKESSSTTKYIYDCVNNKQNIGYYESIYNGKDALSERAILSDIKDNYSVDSLLTKLNAKYSDAVTIEVLDDNVDRLIKTFEVIKDAKTIEGIFRDRCGFNFKEKMYAGQCYPMSILNSFDEMNNTEFARVFYGIQKEFISGQFGEYSLEDDTSDSLYGSLYAMFGDVLYMLPKYKDNCKFTIEDMQSIASEVKNYNFDYTNRISKTKELKSKIAYLRGLNLNRQLSESYTKFCIRNYIDINGLYANLIDEVMGGVEFQNNTVLFNNFKNLNKRLKIAEGIIAKNGDNPVSNNDKVKLINTLAGYRVFTNFYNKTDLGNQAIVALAITYKRTINKILKMIDRHEFTRGENIASSIIRVKRFKGNSESTLKYVDVPTEYPILELVKRNEDDNVSLYELYVLENIGIKVVNNANRNSNIRKLIDTIPFGITYNRFLETSSASDYNKLNGYKKESLPEYARKKLNTRAYRNSKEQLNRDELFRKDNINIQKTIQSLVQYDEERIDLIRKAIKNGDVDERKVLRYSIPDKVYNNNAKVFNVALQSGWESLDEASQRTIQSVLTNCEASCYIVVDNLDQAELIPEELKSFADKIREFTM